jgi:PAS domain S-box-containing protein
MNAPKILVVEDDGIIGQHLKSSLKHMGYVVSEVVTTGADAIQSTAETLPDLVLMDIVLEGEINGIEAARQINEKFNIPVVYLTAYSDEKILQQAKITNPFGYVLKPFDEHNLHATLEMALQKHQLELRLRESEQRYGAVVEQSSDGIVLIDPANLEIVEVNPAFLALVGLPRQEVLNRYLTDIIKHDDTHLNQTLTKISSERYFQMREVSFHRKDGQVLDLELSIDLVAYARKEMLSVIIRNITARKVEEAAHKRRAQELEALYKTLLEITSQRELSALLHAIVERAAVLLRSNIGGLYLMNAERQGLELVVSYNLPGDYDGIILHLGEGVSGRVAQTGAPLMVEDYRKSELIAPQYIGAPFRRVLGVPFKVGERLIGVIIVTDSEKTGLYSQEEVKLLGMFADQAAIAVENARLYEAVQKELAERQRVEEALQRSEENYRLIFQRSPLGIFHYDTSLLVTECNERLAKIIGAQKDELIGYNLNDIEDQSVMPAFRAALEGKEGSDEGLYRFSAGAPETWLSLHTAPMLDTGGKITGGIAIIEDISDRKKAEDDLQKLYAGLELQVQQRTSDLAKANEQLQESERQVKALLDSIPDMAWFKDEESRFIAANRAMEKFYNVSADWLVGKTDFDLDPGDLADRYRADDQEVMRTRQPKRIVEILRDHQGHEFWAETIKVPILNDSDQVIGTSGVARDITLRKEAEAILERSHAEMEALVQQRTAELEQLNQALRDDIAQRKQVEDALRESEAGYRSLFATAQRQAQELTLLDQVRTALTRELDLNEIFRAVVEAVAQTFGYTQVSVYWLEGDIMKVRHKVGYPNYIAEIPISTGVIGRVTHSGQAELITDVDKDPDFLKAIDGVVSEICVPLFDAGKVVGILNVESTVEGALGQSDFRLMIAVGEQVNVAITKARLYAQLSENEERYRTFVQNFQGIAYRFKSDYSPVFLHGAVEAMTGYIERDFLDGKIRWDQIVHPDDGEIFHQFDNELSTIPNFSAECEYRILRKDGQIKWVHDLMQNIFDEAGKSLLFQGAAYDVTERKRVELVQGALHRISQAALTADSLNHLYSSIHQILGELMPAKNFFIALYDPETELVSFPYFVDEKDKVPPPRKHGTGLTEYVLSIGQPLFVSPELFDELLRRGVTQTVGPSSVDWLGVPLRGKDRIIGVMAVQTYQEGERFGQQDLDILTFVSTQVAMAIERKQAEQALRTSEEKYRSLVENLPVGVYRTTPGAKGEFLAANPAFLRLFGFNSVEELARVSPADLNDDPAYRKVFSDTLISQGTVNGLEMKLKKKDGTPLWGLVRARVVSDEMMKEVAYFDCSIEDVTERRERERTMALAYEATLEGWARALELRDRETEGHAKRVTETTVLLARTMGFSEEALVHIRRGALLHDIGKLGIPDSILFKQDLLAVDEIEIMRRHPVLAYEMLQPIQFLGPALTIPYCHHEKWDGSGYPRGLKGEEIPLEARIFAIVDVWDSLSYDRPYRKAWSKEKIHDYLLSESGLYFDPKVVEEFIKLGL